MKIINKRIKERYKVLYSLLVSFFVLSSFALLIALSGYFEKLKAGIPNQGASPLLVIFFWLIFLLAIIVTKRNNVTLGSLILITSFLSSGIYSSIRWGGDLPQALLIYAITIIISGILLGTRFTLLLIVFIGIFISIISHLQANHIIEYDNHWLSQPPDFTTGIFTAVSFGIIGVVSWLYNREIETSLRRAESSEEALKKERDLLEIKVEQRTEELKKEQLEKILNLYRFADFGKLASGLLHDLVSPLTTVSLNLEQLSKKKSSVTVNDIDEIISRTVEGTKRMESYVKAARAHIQKQSIEKHFYLRSEIENVLYIFAYRIKKEHIQINIDCKKSISMIGNPIKFNQLISNLLANALDSYDEIPKQRRGAIAIIVIKEEKSITIMIEDHGKGIKKSHLSNIFDPFFTTKRAEKGTGIGLSISKDIVEKVFHGTIEARSTQKRGSTFIVSFPLKL